MASLQARTLLDEIKSIFITNVEGHEIVPYSWLADLMTLEKVESVIREGKIEEYERRPIAQDICENGLRTFATLVVMEEPDLIYDFMRLDSGMNKGSPDNRLPQEMDDLHQIFRKAANGSDNWSQRSNEFFKHQFVFAIPSFGPRIRHRDIREEIRLPFLNSPTKAERKEEPQGNFGIVSKVQLPPVRNSIKEGGVMLVRKQLKVKGGNSYKKELRCLSLLSSIQHPNIVELYGSYTQRLTHNFLLREAADGDLYDLLTKDSRPYHFMEDEALALAVCGLASALEQLHDYSNKELDIKLIGCHHDLKPRNILVDGPRLILTDFGLSEMSDAEQGLRREDADRDLYFDCPERLDYTTFARRDTGQEGDIWSLGCILAVIFGYMKGGPKELQYFRERRSYICKVDTNIYTILKSFHRCGGEHPEVSDWLDGKNWHPDSPKERTTDEKELVGLIRDMLSIDPSKRPGVREVLRRLRCVALKKAAGPLRAHQSTSQYVELSVDYAVERQVFLEWIKRIDNRLNKDQPFLCTYAVFEHVYTLVCDIRTEFMTLTKALKHEGHLFARLRRMNEELLSYLEGNSRRDVRWHAELSVLPTVYRDGERLELGHDRNKPVLILTENVRQLMNDSASTIPRVDPDRVKLASIAGEESQLEATRYEETVRTFRVGTLDADSTLQKPIIVEELDIVREDYNDPKMSEQLFAGLEHILNLSLKEAANIHALSCAGIYHDEEQRKIGLVYSYPESISMFESRPTVRPLVELLKEFSGVTNYSDSTFVALDDRLALACDLATTVFRFHTVGWWHKGISSYNILVFNTGLCPVVINNKKELSSESYCPRKLRLGPAALIGFSHSRSGDAPYSNKMHCEYEALFPYRHPHYTGADTNEQHGPPYQPKYDYYSLGIVLLEIGLWESVSTMLVKVARDEVAAMLEEGARDEVAQMIEEVARVEVAKMSSDKIFKTLLGQYVPFLAATMGKPYAAAVEACLTGALVEDGKEEGVEIKFERLVLTPLGRMRTAWSLS